MLKYMSESKENDKAQIHNEIDFRHFSTQGRIWVSTDLLELAKDETTNEYNNKKLFFQKYMPFTTFLSSFVNKNLYLANPSRWEDPFETRYMEKLHDNKKLDKGNRLLCFKAYGTCFKSIMNNEDEPNEDAAWKIYGGNSSMKVRVTFKIGGLIESLNNSACSVNGSLYLTTMAYCDRKFIVGETGIDPHFDKTSKENKDEVLFVNNFILKQNAYQYEKEVRLCCITKNEEEQNHVMINNFDWSKVIKYVTLPPINYKDDDLIQKINDNIKMYQQIKYLNSNIKVMRSNLYDKEEKKMVTEIKL